MHSDITSIVKNVFDVISGQRFPLQDEKQLQRDIFKLLNKQFGKSVERERALDDKRKSIIDFFISGVGIEVKIKAQKRAIYDQCERYCSFDEIKAIILITNQSMGFPKELKDKDCYVLNLGLAWL